MPISPNGSILSRFSRKSKKSSSAKAKKSVRFNQSVVARPSLHKNNYTSQELADTWYNSEESETIRRDVMKTLALMRSGNLVEPEDDDNSIELESDDCVSDDDCTVATNDSNSRKFFRHSGSFRSISSNGTSIYNSKPSSQDSYVSTSRGLENYTAKGSHKSGVRKHRQNAVWAVMEEQDQQVDQAECLEMTYLWYDDEAIREVYRKYSKSSMQTARLLGIADSGQDTIPSVTTKAPTKPRRHSMYSAPKTIRKFFSSSSSSTTSEDDLIKKAAASFSSSEYTSKKSHSKQQRRSSWFTSISKTPLPVEGRRGAAALVA